MMLKISRKMKAKRQSIVKRVHPDLSKPLVKLPRKQVDKPGRSRFETLFNRPMFTQPTVEDLAEIEEERQMKEGLQKIAIMKREKQRAQELKEKIKAISERKKKQEEAEIEKKKKRDALRKKKLALQAQRDQLVYGKTGRASSCNNNTQQASLATPVMEGLAKGEIIEQMNDLRKIESVKLTNYNDEQPENPSVVNKIIDITKFEKKMTKVMFKKSIAPDEFLKKITSTEIFKYAHKENASNFPVLSESFRDFKDYHKNWMPLFEYESFCQLTNLRKEGAKCKVANYGWLGKIAYIHSDKFVNFRMDKPISDKYQFDARNNQSYYKQQPNNKRADQVMGRGRMHWEEITDSLRENDLLLFSKYKLTGIYDLFDVSTEKRAQRFLSEVLPRNGTFIAMVNRRRKLRETYVAMKTDRFYKDDLLKIISPGKKTNPMFY